MKKFIKLPLNFLKCLLAGLVVLMIFIGCNRIDSPTVSHDESSSDLWNPQPGDQIIPGHEVPILQDGYWESLYGPTINPLRIMPSRLFH